MNGTTVFLISMLVAFVCMIFFGILISAIIMIVVTVLFIATKPAGGDDRTIPSIVGSVAGLAIGYLLNMLCLMALVL